MNKTLHINSQPVTLQNLIQRSGEATFILDGTTYHFRGRTLADGKQVLEQEVTPGVWQMIQASRNSVGKGMVHIEIGSLIALVSEQQVAASTHSAVQPLSPRAPMPGLVRKLLVQVGDNVAQGQAVAVMEAMKLQVTLNAGGEGVVEKCLVSEGDMIAEGAELFRITPKEMP